MTPMTSCQCDVLLFILCECEEGWGPPTMQEIRDRFGWKSTNAAQTHVDALTRKGLLERRPGKSRGFRVTVAGKDAIGEVV